MSSWLLAAWLSLAVFTQPVFSKGHALGGGAGGGAAAVGGVTAGAPGNVNGPVLVNGLKAMHLMAGVDPSFRPFKEFTPRPIPSVPAKHDWCHLNFSQGLKKALRGHTLSVAIQDYVTTLPMILYNASSNKVVGGLLPRVLDEAAKRGNFTWRSQASMIYGSVSDALLLQETLNFDLAMDWYSVTPERVQSVNVRFGIPFLDMNILLLTPFDVHSESMIGRAKRPFRPFHWQVWVAIAAFFVLGAMTYYAVEFDRNDNFQHEHWTRALFQTTASFFGGFGFEPASVLGRVFVVAWSIWILIMTSAYTANLANLLINNSGSTPRVSSLEEATARRLTVCTRKGWYAEQLVKLDYPRLRIKSCATAEDFYSNIHSGVCHAGIVQEDLWDAGKHIKWVNPSCNLEALELVGRYQLKASWATGQNLYTCDDRLADVLNALLMEMWGDGWIQSVKADIIAQISDQKCSGQSSSNSGSLAFSDLTGVFVIPGVFSLFGLIVDFATACFGCRVFKKAGLVQDPDPVTTESAGETATEPIEPQAELEENREPPKGGTSLFACYACSSKAMCASKKT